MSKIAIIIAFRDFRDEEYFIPKEILEKAGIEVKTFSTNLGKAVGSYGGEAEVDSSITDLKIQDFDAIVFVGGAGAFKYVDNPKANEIILSTIKENKILGAICIAPVILAKAGVLKGKKATVWSSPMDKSPVKMLKEEGAEYLNEEVVVDDKIITANGPSAAERFGRIIVEVLTKNFD